MGQPRTDGRVDEYLDRARQWQEESRRLRAICLDTALAETLKWRQPCYTFQDGNVAIISGFSNYCALGFFKGSLLDDPHHVLEQPGEHSRAMRQLRFTSVEEIDRAEPVIRAYIDAAIELEKTGASVDYSEDRDVPVPDELTAKFAELPALKTAFDNLTPGRQRAYLLYFSDARQSQTRTARIEKYADRILDGQGLRD